MKRLCQSLPSCTKLCLSDCHSVLSIKIVFVRVACTVYRGDAIAAWTMKTDRGVGLQSVGDDQINVSLSLLRSCNSSGGCDDDDDDSRTSELTANWTRQED